MDCAPLSGAFEKAADAEVARLNNSTRLTKPTARVPGLFECLSPPVSLDLTKDKAAIFTWLVELLMKDSQRSRSTGSISNELNLREPLKCLFWCNDHTFIVPSNLIAYTRSKAISSSYPLYAGKELKSGGRNFNSGAAGILLNRWSLGILMGHWKRPKDHPECFPPNLQDRSARPLRKIANVCALFLGPLFVGFSAPISLPLCLGASLSVKKLKSTRLGCSCSEHFVWESEGAGPSFGGLPLPRRHSTEPYKRRTHRGKPSCQLLASWQSLY